MPMKAGNLPMKKDWLGVRGWEGGEERGRKDEVEGTNEVPEKMRGRTMRSILREKRSAKLLRNFSLSVRLDFLGVFVSFA